MPIGNPNYEILDDDRLLGESVFYRDNQLVTGNGSPVSGGGPLLQLYLKGTTQHLIFDRQDGRYICTGYNSEGQYFAQLYIGAATAAYEDPATISPLTTLTATATGLLKTDGTTIGTGGVCIWDGAWWLSPTKIVGLARGLGADAGKSYLFVISYNGTAWTVGNNAPAHDNKRASVNVGAYAGGQAALVSALHARSGATDGAGNFIFGEYNIAAGRVAGAANDAVRVHRTADYGATWTSLCEWNTNGTTNQIRHVHAVKYSPHTGYWYILTGDDPSSAMIRWDGSAASPPANTELWNYRAYPGWDVYRDSVAIPEASATSGLRSRSGDIAIGADSLHYMCDNTESNTALSLAYQVSAVGPMRVIQGGDYVRPVGLPPLLCIEVPGGGAFWFSMIEQTAVPDAVFGAYGYHIWYTPDGWSFISVNWTKDNGSHGAGYSSVIYNALWCGEDTIVISGTGAKNCRLLAGSGGAASGSLILGVRRYDGTIAGLRTTG